MAGRPPIFETPEQMQEATDAYFAARDSDGKPYTVAGLARHLGMTRETLLRYAEKDGFSDTVKDAKQRVEEFLESRLYESSPTGAIFNLKNNFGWKDQQDHNIGGQGGESILIEFVGVDNAG